MTVIIASTTADATYSETTTISPYVTVGQMSGSAGSKLYNFGAIMGDGVAAVVMAPGLTYLSFVNYANALVFAPYENGVDVGSGGTSLIDNRGTIIAASAILVHYDAANYSIKNSGTISATSYGIVINAAHGAPGATITNSGTIEADGTAILLSGPSSPLIINTGTIHAPVAIQADGGGRIELQNSGTVIGSISAQSSNVADVVTNSGRINGSLSLGSGNDEYRATGNGSVGNIIAGAQGNDTLHGGGLADRIDGGSENDLVGGGGGNDTMDGGTGSDTVDYTDKSAGIAVTLNGSTTTTVQVGGVNEDSIKNFENVLGGAGSDKITGDGAANTLIGNGGNDSLVGGSGNDVLKGGSGHDVLDGGSGIDWADYSDQSALVEIDLDGANIVTAKVGGVAEDTLRDVENLIGGTGANKLIGDAAANIFLGKGGNDTLSGMEGADSLDGGTGNDKLDGGTGNDTLVGGAGNDTLTGGTGSDTFRFTFPVGPGNIDIITDFKHPDDTIALAAGLGTGALNSTYFRSTEGGHAGDSNDFIIYDHSNGTLWFDADAGGSGAAVQIATFSNHAVLTASDFLLV